jgi:hypothetical protein
VNGAAALVAVAAVLGAASGCKKKRGNADEVLAVFHRLRDMMCACRDQACVDKVQEDMNRWSAENARSAGAAEPKLRPEELQQVQQLGTEYGECMAKVMGNTDVPPEAPVAAPVERLTNADQILKRTYDGLKPNQSVGALSLSYVRADGTVDPTYGTVEIQLAKPPRPDPADDPARPIGAPVPVDPAAIDDVIAKCPVHTWKNGARTASETPCFRRGALTRPKCSVVEVWKRAIDAGAPANGLAVLALHEAIGDEPQSWTFSIEDAPRNIHFAHVVVDTCQPTLEKP